MALKFTEISRFIFIVALNFIFIGVNLGQSTIKGSVSDTTYSPIPFCTIALLNSIDSSIVKGTITDEKGEYQFLNIVSGIYIIQASSVGFKKTNSLEFKMDSTSNITKIDLTLKSDSKNLSEVTVTSIKKTIEMKDGMIVMNVEDSPLTAGNTVFDLIKKIPGVFVDNQNNIILSGKGSVKIMINGQIQRISNDQLVSILMGMNAELVSKIEVMRNPPVKYDSEGTGGLINIITKKVKVMGLSGSVNSNLNKGDFYRGSVNVSIDYKFDKIVIFSNLGYANRIINTDYEFNQNINKRDSLTYLKQKGNQKITQQSYNYKLGADYYINKKNTIGFFMSGAITSAPFINTSKNAVSGYNEYGYDYTTSTLQLEDDFSNPNYNINAEHRFDTTGTVLNFSADYSGFKENKKKFNENLFLNQNGIITQPEKTFQSFTNSKIDIYTQKLDFTKLLKYNFTIEAGLKSTIVQNNNEYIFNLKNPSNGDFENDSVISNNYIYNEKTFAGYINFKKEFKVATIQLGSRLENTIIDAHSDNSFKLHKNYTKVFPSFSVDYHKSDKHSIQINLSKRIDRPSYKDLNPFLSYDDYYSSSLGNPYLLPQINYSSSLTYAYNQTIYNTIGYYINYDYIINIDIRLDTTNALTNTMENAKSYSSYYYSLYYQKEFFPWWNISAAGDFYYQSFRGNINNTSFNRTNYTYNFSVNNDILLYKKYKLMINGNYYSPSIYGTTVSTNFWWVDIGLKKSYLKDKLIFNVNVSDIFHTNVYSTQIKFQNQDNYYKNVRDTRRVSLSIIYKFGKLKIRPRENTSNDTEKARLESQMKK